MRAHEVIVVALAVLVACGTDEGPTPPTGAGPTTGDRAADAGALGADAGADGSTTLPNEPPAPPPACPAGNTGPGVPPNGSVPGALTFPFPTLRNVTVEWALAGDANTNGVVEVRFKKQSETSWRKGLPLRRIPAGSVEGFTWLSRHSGSLFDLEPETTYDVEAFLLDPDGGCEVRTGAVTTRGEPRPMAGAPVKAVTPATLASVFSGAQPGDILELAAGTYPAFSFAKDGSAGKPIVIRAAGDVTIGGELSLIGRKFVHIVGLKINGRVRLNQTTEVAVLKNVVTTTGDGIVAGLRSENLVIADNVVQGATAWSEGALGVSGSNVGEGILVTGPGHVIEHNKVRGFRDGLSLLEDGEAVDQFSIDFIENDVELAADDGIEADFCFHNCRVLRNRFRNVFMAMSSQPGLGGPTYFIRNVATNVVLSAFKLQRGSIGDVLLHNTVVKGGDAFGIYTTDPFSRQLTRNNLMLGGPGGTYNGYSNGSGKVMALEAASNGDYDYDGFGSTTGKFEGRVGAITFTSLADMKAKTTEKHGVAVALDVFAAAVTVPATPFPEQASQDVRLKAAGAAIDVGVILPNVGGYTGSAPDLGAIEHGVAAPAYGPR